MSHRRDFIAVEISMISVVWIPHNDVRAGAIAPAMTSCADFLRNSLMFKMILWAKVATAFFVRLLSRG